MNENAKRKIGEFFGRIIGMFLQSWIILIGIHILQKYGAPIPNVSYWEVFLLRWAFVCVVSPFVPKSSIEVFEKDGDC